MELGEDRASLGFGGVRREDRHDEKAIEESLNILGR
jgi:hypothetical protein